MSRYKNVLLSTACFAPVQYFTKLMHHQVSFIEQHEHFIKQTYRNRYEILGANGRLALVVPVVKGRGRKIKIRDLQISYDTNWQRNHWRTIFSAYNSSPFFEYYQDDIRPYFEKPWKFLFDFNQANMQTILDLLEIENQLKLTPGFRTVPDDTFNLHEAITLKSHKAPSDEYFHPQPYTQVFSEKFGFTPNLSILDLLFNEGPNSAIVLENSMK